MDSIAASLKLGSSGQGLDDILRDRIWQACAGELKGANVDYQTNVDIIDFLVQNSKQMPLLGKTAVKEIRALIDDKCKKSSESCILAAALLEMLSKNVDGIVSYFADVDFLKFLAKHGKPDSLLGFFEKLDVNTTNSEIEIVKRNKFLELIQNWALSFNPKLFPSFHEIYDELKKEGVLFPIIDPDMIYASAATKPRKAFALTPKKEKPSESFSSVNEVFQLYTDTPGPVLTQLFQNMTGFSDKDAVSIRDTCLLLFEILNQSHPKENISSNEMIVQIVQNLQASSVRIGNRLSGNLSEKVTIELLACSDLIQQMFTFREGIIRGTQKRVRPDLVDAEKAKLASLEKQKQTSKSPEVVKPREASKSFDTSNQNTKISKPAAYDDSEDILGLGISVTNKVSANTKSSPEVLPQSTRSVVVPMLGPPPSVQIVHDKKFREKKIESDDIVLPANQNSDVSSKRLSNFPVISPPSSSADKHQKKSSIFSQNSVKSASPRNQKKNSQIETKVILPENSYSPVEESRSIKVEADIFADLSTRDVDNEKLLHESTDKNSADRRKCSLEYDPFDELDRRS